MSRLFRKPPSEFRSESRPQLLFLELRERLLRAGVAPRHVRRYEKELSDHLADLVSEEENAGRNREAATSLALARLGGIDALAEAMTHKPQFQSWCARAPWAVFGLGPVLLAAAAYSTAGFILWSGWNVFLPQADTPFIRAHGLATYYFAVGRTLYFDAPVLVGWAMALVAVRQRFQQWWPVAGAALLATIGGAIQVHTQRAPGGAPHVSLGLDLAPSGHLLGMMMYFSLSLLPWLAWKLVSLRSKSAGRRV
jgi:hypothetical protein